MSLTTLNESEPAGFRSVDKGAGEIRLTRKDSKDSIALQHWLSGEHRFPAAGAVTPAVGQIALDGSLLRYGTGSSWVTGTFPSYGITGGMGVVLTSTNWVNILSMPVQTNIVDYSAWLSGVVKFKRTVSYITSAYMEFQIYADVPPPVYGFYVTGVQVATTINTTGRMESEWVPIVWGMSYHSLDAS